MAENWLEDHTDMEWATGHKKHGAAFKVMCREPHSDWDQIGAISFEVFADHLPRVGDYLKTHDGRLCIVVRVVHAVNDKTAAVYRTLTPTVLAEWLTLPD